MNGEQGPRVVVLAGATATGKTELAVAAARAARVPVEILSLDSRQLYRDLDVATGKPDAAQRAAVPHHLLDLLDADATPQAMWYREQARGAMSAVLARGAVPLLVGGSGFYLRALRVGFHELGADADALAEVRRRVAALDDDDLRATLSALDPRTAERLHPHDRYRLGRALELAWLSGTPPSELESRFQPRPVLAARFEVLVLQVDRAVLHDRIAHRTERWLAGGWPEEVQAMLARGVAADAPALRTLGYREVVRWVAGVLDAGRTREQIVVATRRCARQQETWFRKEPGALAIRSDDLTSVVQALERAGGSA